MKKIPIRQITSAQKQQSASEHFSIRTVQDLLADKDLFHDLHRHDFFFILVLKKGEGTHEIDFTKFEVFDKSVFFLRPGQVYQLQLKAGSTGYLMEFNNEFYHPLTKYLLNDYERQAIRIFVNWRLTVLKTCIRC